MIVDPTRPTYDRRGRVTLSMTWSGRVIAPMDLRKRRGCSNEKAVHVQQVNVALLVSLLSSIVNETHQNKIGVIEPRLQSKVLFC